MGEPGADLHRPAYTGWLTGELDRILGVTDVHRARRDGIFPLPARARDAAGVLQVVEYRPAEHSAPAPVEPAAPAPSRQARGAGAGAAVEERAARPQPAQPADQLHRARPGWRSPCPAPALGDAGELRPRRDADHPAARRPAGRRPEGARRRHRARAARGAARRALVERREVHADVTTGGYLPRLRGLAYKAQDRAWRRPAPTTCTWRSAAWCGSSTAARCARRWCSSRSPSRRWAAPARTG